MDTVTFCLLQLFKPSQRGRNDLVHVVVFIISQPSAEDHVFFLLGQLLVLGKKRIVLLVVDRLIRLHPDAPL